MSTALLAATVVHALVGAAAGAPPAPLAPSGAVAPAPAPMPAIAAVVWKPITPGAERGVADEGDVRLEMLRFDLDRYDAEVVVTGRERPARARVWMPGARHTAAEILRHGTDSKVVAVVNGGFFDENGRSLGLRLTHDVAAVPLRGGVDWGVFYVAGRRAHIVHSREFAAAPGIQAAIQVGPRILIDGVVPRLKPQIARRTAVALDRDGKSVTLVVVQRPIDATALGNRLAACGFHAALLLDGGPSTQLSAAVGVPVTSAPDIRSGPGRLEIPGAYPVPDLLAIVRR